MFKEKKNIILIILTVWAVISVAYIAYGLLLNFKNNMINQAYIAGKTDTIDQLIKQSETSSCQPFFVYNGEKQAQLVNSSCLAK